jgi:hypothetical protein
MTTLDPGRPSGSEPNGPRGKEWVLAVFLIFAAVICAGWAGNWWTPDRSVADAPPPPPTHHSMAGAASAQ